MARRLKKAWEKFPAFPHLNGAMREAMERRRRHRQVRYLLFSLQNAELQNLSLDTVRTPDYFPEFWLKEKPTYAIDANGNKVEVLPVFAKKTVLDLGGYSTFAKKWDVDEDLRVYLRFLSVWQAWNARLMQVVPVLGEGE